MGKIVQMNNNNGLGRSQTGKKQIEIDERIRVAQIDHDFYSAGLPFSNGTSHSANHLYGNGKWKKTVIDLFGHEALKQYGSYYGQRPVDFPLIAFDTEYAKFFVPGEKITIKDNTGLYHDIQAKVVGVKDKKSVMVAVPFKQGAENVNGVLLNNSRIKGAADSLGKLKQMQAEITGTSSATNDQRMSNITETPSVVQTVSAKPEIISEQLTETKDQSTEKPCTPNIPPFTDSPVQTLASANADSDKSGSSRALIVFVLALLAIGAGYLIYTHYKPQILKS